MQILARRQEMTGWEDGLELFDSMTGLDPTADIDFEDFRLGREVHALPLEEQARQIKDAGLEGQIKPVEGYRQEALDIAMDNKRLENAAGLVSENQGVGGTIAGFGAGLAASFMDPINIAIAFVPVAGEARVMSLMAGASGIGQRAAIRAGLGAASGALGAAMIEPMIYLGQQEVQADYTLANSMLNMGFGAIMGGVMHAGGGTFAEWRRARAGKAQPWEYVSPDDDSQALMQAHAEEIARFRQEANPNADPELIRQSALADASLFDSHARNWAYHERKTVGEYYQQNRPEYRSWQPDFERMDDAGGFEWREDGGAPELPQGDMLYHAMYLDPEKDFAAFIEKGKSKKAGAKQSYFQLSGDGIPQDVNVRVSSDMAIHQGKNHPDMTPEDNRRLSRIVADINGGNTSPFNEKTIYGWRYGGMQTVDGTTYAYVFDVSSNRALFTTFFKGEPEKVAKWFKKAKEKASMMRGGPDGSHNSATYHGKPIGSLSDIVAEVKQKIQISSFKPPLP